MRQATRAVARAAPAGSRGPRRRRAPARSARVALGPLTFPTAAPLYRCIAEPGQAARQRRPPVKSLKGPSEHTFPAEDSRVQPLAAKARQVRVLGSSVLATHTSTRNCVGTVLPLVSSRPCPGVDDLTF